MSFFVQIEQLTKEYKNGTIALKGVDLEIGTGMFGLLGPNGAGKTTLMRILATLLLPTSGRAAVGGDDVAENPRKVRQSLGYLPQDFRTYRHLTVEQVLDYIALLKGLTSDAKRRSEVGLVLEKVALEKKRRARIRSLSGGMLQRVGIAQAILGQPKLLIVDEPTTGLDPEERIRFRNLLAQLSEDRVVILSTHIVADVESSCYRLAVLNEGEVRFVGEPGELAAEADGFTWEVEVPEALPNLSLGAKVVATRRLQQGVHMRIISTGPPLPGARLVEPSLEDGYLATVRSQGGGVA